MHIHIIGICGTFMGGIAGLAKAAGHRVTGCDREVYPPMSEELARLGIEVTEGWDPGQLEPAPDMVVIGNVMSRGNPLVEAVLEQGLPYTSGPDWLAEHVLAGRRVLAVAGTHGKTTTSSLLAWILEASGLEPGFLIGGVPLDFGASARLGGSDLFVVEADEYDTAFFDKRAKFVHYRPRVAVLNNLEYDHADIYADMAAIRWQFHQLIRTVPGGGRLVVRAGDAELAETLAMGCWTPVETFAAAGEADWRVDFGPDGEGISLAGPGGERLQDDWPLAGEHNLENTAAAVAAAAAVGVEPAAALAAVARFRGVRRRLELAAEGGGIRVYDDFAHHPTAIARTLAGLRRREPEARIVVALEPRSNTMRLGVHRETLAGSLAGADRVFVFAPDGLEWDLAAALASLGDRATLAGDYGEMAEGVLREVAAGDILVLMSNGGFGGLRERVVAALSARG
ncbi:UDP-N-acetylmuramate:L-alanyl-gamma-D-glutamyl-meso-diaminopimelate ligase [Lentisalinibacter orientalis]|uniref:UDP-N-acetylmuramate:L-alanyl-gamma-D-glutamyl- meso-diaminopimelate ligase n=1 Tax=Lentisalinibacter orientalis TaxID=2992241 RepID=UPI00386598A4